MRRIRGSSGCGLSVSLWVELLRSGCQVDRTVVSATLINKLAKLVNPLISISTRMGPSFSRKRLTRLPASALRLLGRAAE